MIERGYLKNVGAISGGLEKIWNKKQFLLHPSLQLKLWLVPKNVCVWGSTHEPPSGLWQSLVNNSSIAGKTMIWNIINLSQTPGGALGYFLGGYVLPGTPNWHPVLKKISSKLVSTTKDCSLCMEQFPAWTKEWESKCSNQGIIDSSIWVWVWVYYFP